MDESSNLPLVSIVIPTYNHASYLDSAIESILEQDYPKVELLVFNDGSTDHTHELLQKYSGEFYWETQENMGQAATLNKGWQIAKGEVLSYLSSDDVLLPHAVSTSVEYLMAEEDVVMTYCDFDMIDTDGEFVRHIQAPYLCYRDMVVKWRTLPGPGAFLRRGAAENAGPWDTFLRHIPDHEYWLRLGLQGRFKKIPETLALFRVHDESQSFARTEEFRTKEYLYVARTYFALDGVPESVRAGKSETFSNAYIASARLHLAGGRYVEGAKSLCRALRLCPRNLSLRTFHVLAYGLWNRTRHRFRQRVRDLLKVLNSKRAR
jgi:glycosyltransferase involved in cell wall biosynthesis